MVDKLYIKLFNEAYEKGKYHTFAFDIKNSRKLENREEAQYQIIELIERIYFDLIELEKLLDRQILLHDDTYVNMFDKVDNDFRHKYEPFILGDTVGITIISNSIPDSVLLSIYELNKKEVGINFEFHVNHGYYETDDYGLGTKQAFRGYAIKILCDYHKDYFAKYRKHHKEKSVSQEELEYYMYLVSINHHIAVENAQEYIDIIHHKTLKKVN